MPRPAASIPGKAAAHERTCFEPPAGADTRTVESLNLLRLRLEQTAPDAKIILLTSTTPQEGKTTLALQFWQLLAGLGQRCLLVDGDLRHSGICRQCGLTGEHKVPGLAHYLSGSVPLEEVLYHTEIRGTCLVPASGTTSRPALLLEHPRFARMVESCARKFVSFGRCSSPSECSDALALPRYVTVPCLWYKAAALPTRSCARRLTFCRAAACRCWALC